VTNTDHFSGYNISRHTTCSHSSNSECLLGHKVSRSTMGPTQALIQWELGTLEG